MRKVHALNLVGEKYGRLTVLSKHGKNKRGEISWLCRCDCGTVKPIIAGHLRKGNTKSCGCYHRDAVTSHGMTKMPTFRSWESMKQRCLNPNNRAYSEYGGRGIKVHSQWIDSFDTFLSDMGDRPKGTSLDRIDVNGDYTPSNCRWATRSEQQRNKRVTAYLKLNGVEKPVKCWSDETGIPSDVIFWRIRNGWSVEKALTTPKRKKRVSKCKF